MISNMTQPEVAIRVAIATSSLQLAQENEETQKQFWSSTFFT